MTDANKTQPAIEREPVDGDLLDAALSEFYSDDGDDLPIKERMTGVLRIVADRFLAEPTLEEIESYRSSYFANGSTWQDNTSRLLSAFVKSRRAHLGAKKTDNSAIEEIIAKHLGYRDTGHLVVKAMAAEIAKLRESEGE